MYNYRDATSGIPKELNAKDMPESLTWTHGTDEDKEGCKLIQIPYSL